MELLPKMLQQKLKALLPRLLQSQIALNPNLRAKWFRHLIWQWIVQNTNQLSVRQRKVAIWIKRIRETCPTNWLQLEAVVIQDVASSWQWQQDTNMLVYKQETNAGLVTNQESIVWSKIVNVTCLAQWTTAETVELTWEITSTECQVRRII